MNPHDEGIVSGYAFHAVMTRAKAIKEHRSIDGADRRFFYNPMWAHFGDLTDGPPGTYNRSSAEAVNCFWNIYDQVLVRPNLVENLGKVRVLARDGVESPVSRNGLPRKRDVTDCLPIGLDLKFD